MRRTISQGRQLIRAYYGGIAKTSVIYPAAFLVATALGQVGLGLLFFVRDVFHLSPARVGLLGSVWSLSYVVGCLFLRPRFDRVLPRYLIIASTASVTVVTVLMPFAPAPWALFVLNAAYGLSLSLFWPPLMGWLSVDLEGPELSKVVGRFNVSWCSGVVVGPLLGGWLSEVSPRAPLAAGSALFLFTCGAVVYAATVLPLVRADRSTGAGVAASGTASGKEALLRFPAWLGLYVSYFSMGVVYHVFPMAAQDQLGLPKRLIGTLLFCRGLANAVTFALLGRVVFWHFRAWPMLSGQLLCCCALLGLSRARSPVPVAAWLGVFGVCVAVSYTNSIFHGASGSRNRSGRMAVHESILAAGMVSGAAVGGMLYQRSGAAPVYRSCAGLLLTGAVTQLALCAWALRRGRDG